MNVRALLAGMALILTAASSQAVASTKLVDFTVSSSGWYNYMGASTYGLPTEPTISGSALLDNTKTDGTSFLALNWVTGTKTWTLSDINIGATSVNWDPSGNFIQFGLLFNPDRNYVYTNNTVQINDEAGNATFCNGCVSIGTVTTSAVPEPGAWALMLIGVGVLGAALRTRRRNLAATVTAAAAA